MFACVKREPHSLLARSCDGRLKIDESFWTLFFYGVTIQSTAQNERSLAPKYVS
jgi:hypothetical protein